MDLNYPLTRYVYRPISGPTARLLSRTFVTPAQITWVATVLTLVAGVALARRAYALGAAVALIASIIDCVDGDLARLTGRASRSGAFLDSVLDRWADAALILGIGFSDLDRFAGITAFALTGSFLTSYTRARAQSLGADCPDGIATRDVRILILVFAVLLGQIMAGLAFVAALGILTAIHRMSFSIRTLDRLEATLSTELEPKPGVSASAKEPGP